MLKVKFVDFSSDAIRNMTMKILAERFPMVQESDNPDFLFYSVFGYEHLKYDCVRIFWTGENIQPDFNICDYAVGFSYMNYEDRYIRVPLYFFYEKDYARAIKKHLNANNVAGEKKFCNFVYSNGNASPERKKFFDLLSAYKHVDSGGRYINNIGGAVGDKYSFQKQYKFSIAFENSSSSGYTTEKILQAFAAGTIPIYWGDPNVGKEFNTGAFINCHDYSSFEDVVQVVKEVDQNDDLFRRYLVQPIGNETQCPTNPLQAYERFICAVCRQDPRAAMRRNNFLIGEKYQREMRELRIKPVTRERVKLFRRR